MRKWKQMKKSIKLKALLNLPLNDKEKSSLQFRNLKVEDGNIISMKKIEMERLYRLYCIDL